MVSTRVVRKSNYNVSHTTQKSSITKSTFSPRSYKSPKKKRAPRGSLLGSGSGTGKSNLWTLEERADLYNRRQNGEDWESICNVRLRLDSRDGKSLPLMKDYPTRTRHAMQQQYSVSILTDWIWPLALTWR